MTESAYESARIGGLEDGSGWSAIRRHLDVQAFGVNAWTAHEADASVIPEHDEVPSAHEELYLVIAGSATFTVNGEEVDAPVGTIVFVRDTAAKRSAVAREPSTTVLAIGDKPGEAYRPRAWEANAEVYALLDSGQYAEAKRKLTEALDRYEDRGGLFYNLACAEAQLGETDAALEHLRTSLRERPALADYAQGDADLASIRDDPRFTGILASF